jgi:hypothetical protein
MPQVPGARLGRCAVAILTAAALCGFLVLLLASVHSSGDYNVAAPVGGDNAGPGIMALLHGSLSGYIARQPVVGLTSILLRLPFVAVASALGANAFAIYQVGAVACLMPLILCGAWLVAAPGLSTEQRLYRFLAVALVLQSPITHNSLTSGHPEGVLSTLLAVVAVLAAMKGRVRWAAVFLGLAISSKETGVIAVLPVLVAVPGRRREVAAIAGGIVLAMCGTVWVADPGAFMSSLHGEGGTRFLTPFSLLWPLSAPIHIGNSLSVARLMPGDLTRTRASAIAFLAAGAVFFVWFSRAWRRGAQCQPLVLLVLLGLLRCLCDSTHEAYYWITLLIPLAAWEAFEDRVPFKTMLLSLSVFVLYSTLGRTAPGYLYSATLGGELLLTFYVARNAMVMPGQQSTSWSGLRALVGPRLVLAGRTERTLG